MPDAALNFIEHLPAEISHFATSALALIERQPQAFLVLAEDGFQDAADLLAGNREKLVPAIEKTIADLPGLPEILKIAPFSAMAANFIADKLIAQAQATHAAALQEQEPVDPQPGQTIAEIGQDTGGQVVVDPTPAEAAPAQ